MKIKINDETKGWLILIAVVILSVFAIAGAIQLQQNDWEPMRTLPANIILLLFGIGGFILGNYLAVDAGEIRKPDLNGVANGTFYGIIMAIMSMLVWAGIISIYFGAITIYEFITGSSVLPNAVIILGAIIAYIIIEKIKLAYFLKLKEKKGGQ